MIISFQQPSQFSGQGQSWLTLQRYEQNIGLGNQYNIQVTGSNQQTKQTYVMSSFQNVIFPTLYDSQCDYVTMLHVIRHRVNKQCYFIVTLVLVEPRQVCGFAWLILFISEENNWKKVKTKILNNNIEPQDRRTRWKI